MQKIKSLDSSHKRFLSLSKKIMMFYSEDHYLPRCIKLFLSLKTNILLPKIIAKYSSYLLEEFTQLYSHASFLEVSSYTKLTFRFLPLLHDFCEIQKKQKLISYHTYFAIIGKHIINSAYSCKLLL